MKKMIVMLMSLLLVGCGSTEVPSFENGTDSDGLHTYYNMDNRCAGLEVVEKDYKNTDPQEMFDYVDYVFVGSYSEAKAQMYDNGKIKENLKVTVKQMIKGQLDDEVTIVRDGGRVSVDTYAQYSGETLLDKDKLAGLSDSNISSQLAGQIYVEVVPKAYFQASIDKDYLFFVKDNDDLEIYNDAYGMLEMVDQNKAKNVYSDEECYIEDFSK